MIWFGDFQMEFDYPVGEYTWKAFIWIGFWIYFSFLLMFIVQLAKFEAILLDALYVQTSKCHMMDEIMYEYW